MSGRMPAAGVAGWRTANGVRGVDDHAEGRRDLRLRRSCGMHRQLELATVSGEPGDGGQRVSLLVTVALLVGLWVAGRRLVGPARAGRAQRLVRVGGYSAVLALTLCKVSVERLRDPAALGPGAGGLLWTGEALFLLIMAIFTAVVIIATAQRSPVTTGTLLRGIAAGLPIGIAVFVFLPLGVVRYQASRVLPRAVPGRLGSTCLDRGARCAGGGQRSGRAPVHVRPGTAACGGSGCRV